MSSLTGETVIPIEVGRKAFQHDTHIAEPERITPWWHLDRMSQEMEAGQPEGVLRAEDAHPRATQQHESRMRMNILPSSIRQVCPPLVKVDRYCRKRIVGWEANVHRFDGFVVLRGNEQVEIAVWPQSWLRVETGLRPALDQYGIGPMEAVH
jgi:hypothetical protein